MDNSIAINENDLQSTKKTTAKPQGRKQGKEDFKHFNITKFMLDYSCGNIAIEHPITKEFKLVSNPYMHRNLGRADFKDMQVEIAERVFKMKPDVIREVFVRCMAQLLANQYFGDTGQGQAYKLFVARFLPKPKGQSNSTGNVTKLPHHDEELEVA